MELAHIIVPQTKHLSDNGPETVGRNLKVASTLPIRFYEGQWDHIEAIVYPDLQFNCRLDLEYFNDIKLPIDLNASIRSFADLELFLAGVAAIKQHEFVIKDCTFWYLFGMRSDRSFHPGMPNYFRDVVAPIINRLPFEREAMVFRPHGTLAMNYLPKCYSGDHDKIWEFFYNDHTDAIIISGDKSAFIMQESETAVTFFHKERRLSGMSIHLSEEGMPYLERALAEKPNAPIMIVDDLCDGGATFIKEGNYLRDKYPDRKLELFVAHGLFSKGFNDLLNIYDVIYTTNSYKPACEIDLHPRVQVIEVI